MIYRYISSLKHEELLSFLEYDINSERLNSLMERRLLEFNPEVNSKVKGFDFITMSSIDVDEWLSEENNK